MDEHDQNDLRLLARLHYVLGGVTAVLALPMLPQIWTNLQRFHDFQEAAARPAAPGLPEIESAGMAAVFLFSFWVLLATLCLAHGTVLAYIGRSIARRRRRLLCLVFSALHVINVPLGTALSIYAFMVLTRPAVKQAFAPRTAPLDSKSSARSRISG